MTAIAQRIDLNGPTVVSTIDPFYTNYDKTTIIEEETCPVCLDVVIDGITTGFCECIYKYHQQCLDAAIAYQGKCPTCRKETMRVSPLNINNDQTTEYIMNYTGGITNHLSINMNYGNILQKIGIFTFIYIIYIAVINSLRKSRIAYIVLTIIMITVLFSILLMC